MKWKSLASQSLGLKYRSYLRRIAAHIPENESANKVSVLYGQLSSAIFYAYLSEFEKTTIYTASINRAVEEAFATVQSNRVSNDYLYGLAGMGWGINHLCRYDFIAQNPNELLNELDGLLFEMAMEELSAGNYDLFYGGIGYGIYFLERLKSNPSMAQKLNLLIQNIEKTAIKSGDGIYWQSEGDKKEKSVDLSFSHGQSMILNFLTDALNLGISRERTEPLIRKLIHHILQQKINTDSGLLFPDCTFEDKEPVISPLRWCHGHLGISTALLNAGTVLKDKAIHQTAIQAALNASQNKGAKKEHLQTSILCHGTLGVAHMFNRLYHSTNKKEFSDAAVYWYKETNQIVESEMGFKHLCNDGKYQHVNGILCGIQGIGLGLIAAISNKEPAWDNCLLLS